MPIAIHKPQVLFFYAAWCGPSQAFGPVLERAVEAYKDQYQATQYYDVDNTEEWILAKHRCLGTPTTVLLSKQGKELARLVGYNSFDATINFLRKGVL
jgi:thiol-disulfide isomerase/thioredoxin